MQRFIIGKAEEGRRLDSYLVKLLPEAETSFIFKMLRKKNITVNRKKADAATRLSAGDSVEMFFSDETFVKMSGGRIPLSSCTVSKDRLDDVSDAGPQQAASIDVTPYAGAYGKLRDIRIVYEDEDFIFIDKPVNVLSQSSDSGEPSVNEWLIGYLLDKGETDASQLVTFKPAFCNRLDRNTTGLVLGGKNLRALQTLSELLRSRNLGKFYTAEVWGGPSKDFPVKEDRFTSLYGFLVKNSGTNQVKVFDNETDAGDYADEVNSRVSQIHTSVRLICLTERGMKLEIELHTGKSHQIRAHLSHLGHPIVGDPKYGKKKNGDVCGQLLRAYKVCFPVLEDYPSISGRQFILEER